MSFNVESETISKNFSCCHLKSHCSVRHDFETSFIGHVKNRGSWIYTDRSSNVENFHYIIWKIPDTNRQPVQNTGGELKAGKRRGHQGRWSLAMGPRSGSHLCTEPCSLGMKVGGLSTEGMVCHKEFLREPPGTIARTLSSAVPGCTSTGLGDCVTQVIELLTCGCSTSGAEVLLLVTDVLTLLLGHVLGTVCEAVLSFQFPFGAVTLYWWAPNMNSLLHAWTRTWEVWSWQSARGISLPSAMMVAGEVSYTEYVQC